VRGIVRSVDTGETPAGRNGNSTYGSCPEQLTVYASRSGFVRLVASLPRTPPARNLQNRNFKQAVLWFNLKSLDSM
jgi:hypothetical protein